MSDIKQILRESPFFWSRLGFCYDPPRLDCDGKPIVFSNEFENYVKVHNKFYDAGIKYHTTILHSGWVADGKYDYSLTDKTLSALLDANPDIYYLPRVKLNVPPDWCKNNPDETFVYYKGPRTAEEISALACTLKHDYFGMELPRGYPVNSPKTEFVDDRPNVGGVISLQSFSSKKWRADAKETLERLIKHIENSPYADRIIGYHIAFGMCGENHQWGAWGRWTDDHGDYGIGNRKRFVEFGKAKYGEELLEKWNVDSKDNIEIPSPQMLLGKKETPEELYFHNNLICCDYYEFISECTADAILDFCKVIKEYNKIAGAFYGYTFGYEAAYAGHCAVDKVINSPYVDFLSSPKGYYRSVAGLPGGEQGPSFSMNKKIAWLDEIDNPTHLSLGSKSAENLNETKTLLYREAIKNFTCGQGFWWMDLGDGWYDAAEVMAEIKNITELSTQINKIKTKSISDVLYVVDEYSTKAMAVSAGLENALLYEGITQLKLSGTVSDILRLTDLYDEKVDLRQYKLIIFANCFKMEKVPEIPEGTLCIWNYTPGIQGVEFGLQNVKKITGMEVFLTEAQRPPLDMSYCRDYVMRQRGEDFPLVAIVNDGKTEIIEKYENGDIKTARKGNNILYTFPEISAEDIHKYACEAGCYVPAPVNCTVYADNRITGFFPLEDVEFDAEVFGELKHIKIAAKGYKYFISYEN